MENARIMIVEDDRIIARDLKNRLKQLGYQVAAIASTRDEALRKAADAQPDLVLMDIVLKGDGDGVQTAEQIRSKFNIPVIYLTAYADDDTLVRAKTTEPYGYLLKPFHIKELSSSIDIALHKHLTEKRLREETKWLDTTLKSIGVAVIATDSEGSITYMNPISEILTGWGLEEASGKDLDKVLRIKKSRAQTIFGKRGAYHTTLTDKEGRENTIHLSATSSQNHGDNSLGEIIVFWSSSEHREEPGELKAGSAPEGKITNINFIAASPYILVLEAIGNILRHEKDIKIINQVSNHTELISSVQQKKPDVVFIDAELPNVNIPVIHRLIMEKSKDTKTILLFHSIDEDTIIQCLHSGLQGCLTDESTPNQFLEAIRVVNKNEIWLDMKVINKLLCRYIPQGKIKPVLKAKLTKKEKEIAKFVVKGFSNKRISNELFISENTVKSHLANIFNKLSVSNRLELAIHFNN